MQKVIAVTILCDGDTKQIFSEIKELNLLLKEGYKIISITPSNSGQGFYTTFLIVLEQANQK